MLLVRQRASSANVVYRPAASAYRYHCLELQPRAHLCSGRLRAGYCSTPTLRAAAAAASQKVDQWGNPYYGTWQQSGKTALQAAAVASSGGAPVQAAVKHEAAAADLTIERDVVNSGSTARDHLANERTFLAWARTGVGFVALGVGLSQIEQVRKFSGSACRRP